MPPFRKKRKKNPLAFPGGTRYNISDRQSEEDNVKSLFRNGLVWTGNAFERADILVTDGVTAAVEPSISLSAADRCFDLQGLSVFPGFADVHVHLREPGFSYKETVASGTMACAAGGYTAVCAMPNLSPVPDSGETLAAEEEIIRRDAVVRVLPYASITMGRAGRGRVTDMEALKGRVCGFSDDGTGVSDGETMREAMRRCAAAGSLIAAHCEDLSLIPPGAPVHDGVWAREHGFPGIPSESEWKPIVRDIALAKETGCRYHVCHVSCRESIEMIARAKAEGADITCETAPHYLLLCDEDLRDEGRFKMNPPLRSRADRDALVRAFLDGTVDCLATDHAPHAESEKSSGLKGSAMGIVGIETAFPLIYTHFVLPGLMPMGDLLDRVCYTPRRRFCIEGGIRPGERFEMCAFDLSREYVIDPSAFYSKGRATPFTGWRVRGLWRMTCCGGRAITPEGTEDYQ